MASSVPGQCRSFRSPMPGRSAKANNFSPMAAKILNVTGVGADVAEARARAYAAIDMIDWPGGFYRRDIGWRALARDPVQLDATPGRTVFNGK